MAKVLIIDEGMTMVQMVGELLRAEGHQVLPFTNSLAALESLDAVRPDLVLANGDAEKTRALGLKVLQKTRSFDPPALLLILASAGLTDASLEALKKSAYDFVPKPFTVDELRLRIQRAISYHLATAENVTLRKQLRTQAPFPQFIATSAKMEEVLARVERVAASDETLLILGPVGSGKELVARTVHGRSPRALAPFVRVSCALQPEIALETELFGARKSPFGAVPPEQTSALHSAEGGTVYLDDVSALSPALQARLLEVLQQPRAHRLVGEGTLAVDVRVVASSTHTLEGKVAQGGFDRDLLRRLSEQSIIVPALCDHAEDIPALIAYFLEGKLNPRTREPYLVTREAMDLCCGYRWPGNVHELRAALDHACVRSQDGLIQPLDLPRALQQRPVSDPDPVPAPTMGDVETAGRALAARSLGASASHGTSRGLSGVSDALELVPLKRFLREQEVTYLQWVLGRVGGSKEKAAELLGISLATIYRKLSEPDEPAETAPALDRGCLADLP